MKLNDTTRNFIDIADVRTCRHCGRDYLRIPMDYRDDPLGYLALEPFAVPASQVRWGWRVADARRWIIHHDYDGTSEGFAFANHRCQQAVAVPPVRHDVHTRTSPSESPNAATQRRDGTMTQPDSIFDVAEKRPSLSFKDAPVGATVTMTVDGPPSKVQARKIDGSLDYWDDGNPKWNAVLNVVVNGEPMSLWAKLTRKPGSLFMALAEAKQASGAKDFGAGGTLTVRVSGYEPNENASLSPRRLYQAKYDPPSVWDAAPGTASDPWAQPQAAPAPTPTPVPVGAAGAATGSAAWPTPTPAAPATPPAAAPAPATTQPPWEMT